MFFEYDSEADSGFLWIHDPKTNNVTREIWPKECEEHIGLLMDQNRKLVGLEILFASAHLDAEFLESARLEGEE